MEDRESNIAWLNYVMECEKQRVPSVGRDEFERMKIDNKG